MIWRPFERSLGDLTRQDLERLILPEPIPEGLFVEYKRDWETRKIARAACSFANSEGGGTVVVGIEANKLMPTRVLGIENDGTLEERVTNVIRSMIAPIPRFAARVVPTSSSEACVVIEVPAGFEPPYLFVPTGQILIRTPTSSEPISINDRETLDRLYAIGRRGSEWATRRLSRVFDEELVDARRATVIFVPNVEGGLPAGGKVFGSNAQERMTARFRHSLVSGPSEAAFASQDEDLEVGADALTFTSGRKREERWVITTRIDGTISAAIVPEPSVPLFPPTKLKDAAKQFVPRVVSFYREVLNFEGRVSIAFSMQSTSGPIRTILEPVSLGTVEVEELVRRVQRAADRSAGRFAWEAEDPAPDEGSAR